MADVKYVVKDEHTLGYLFGAQPGLMGVLSGNKHGHNWLNGPVSILGANIRPATMGDFDTFRVMAPPELREQALRVTMKSSPRISFWW